MRPQKLRFGVIANPERLLAWQADCLRNIEGTGLAELKLFAIPEYSPAKQPKRERPPRSSNSFPVYAPGKRVGSPSLAERIVDFTPAIQMADRLTLRLVSEGEPAPLALAEDVAKLCGYQLDFIILFGLPGIHGDILQSAEFGVWAFRHGEQNQSNTGVGFWEIYDRRPVVVAALERLSQCPGKTIPLYRGYFPVAAWSRRLTSDHVLFGGVEWPAKVCRDIVNGCAGYLQDDPVPVEPPRRGEPSNWHRTRLALRIFAEFLREQLQGLIIRERWHVGIVKAPIHSFLSGNDQPVEWLPEPPHTRFFADPFAIKKGNELAILFEDFDQIEWKGHISAVQSTDGGRTFTGPSQILDSLPRDSAHSSYPYVFEHEGQIFCVPETCEANEVRLYRGVKIPWRWERIGTILHGIPAVDPTLFHYNGMWWIFYTLGGTASNTKLYLASARDLLGPWQLHPGNPVKTDVRGARPGGTPFVHEGLLYRPAQDSTRTYGGSLVIHRVDKLTPTQYEETFVCRVNPTLHGKYSGGFHTIAAAGDVCVVDGKQFVAIPEVLPSELREKLNSALRRIIRA